MLKLVRYIALIALTAVLLPSWQAYAAGECWKPEVKSNLLEAYQQQHTRSKFIKDNYVPVVYDIILIVYDKDSGSFTCQASFGYAINRDLDEIFYISGTTPPHQGDIIAGPFNSKEEAQKVLANFKHNKVKKDMLYGGIPVEDVTKLLAKNAVEVTSAARYLINVPYAAPLAEAVQYYLYQGSDGLSIRIDWCSSSSIASDKLRSICYQLQQ